MFTLQYARTQYFLCSMCQQNFFMFTHHSVLFNLEAETTASATSNRSRLWEKYFFIEYSTTCRGKTSPPQFTGSPYIVRYVPKASFWECSYALSTSQAFPIAPRSHDHVTFQLHSVALTFLSSSYFPILPFKAPLAPRYPESAYVIRLRRKIDSSTGVITIVRLKTIHT